MNTDIKFFITESLFNLLKVKNINNIKITEIVKLSNISRTTFYNNFKNIDDVINYKFILVINDLYKIYKLNELRNLNLNYLLKEILEYINKNKNLFVIIRNKLFFEFKNILDKFFLEYINKYNYYIKSGIIINLCLYYIDNNFNIELDKIKID